MPASRRCRDCPRTIPTGTYKNRCTNCARNHSKSRGTPTQRGYGSTTWPTPLGTMTYDQCRARYQTMLADGVTIACACGCGVPIGPGFHLGHNDERTCIIGPMTPRCNTSAAGQARHH